MRQVLRIGTLFLCTGLIVIAAGWIWLDQWRRTPGPLAADTIVDLRSGTGVRGVAAQLAEAGVIDRPLAFEAAVRLEGRDHRLLAGEYRFPVGTSPTAVLALLESGRVVQHPITIPEGLTVKEVFELLAASDVLSGELPPMPEEGSLLPETYLVPRGEPRPALVARLTEGMEKALAEAWAKRREGLPLASPHDALILASIIERETAIEAEYPLVAAVMLNRMRRGMRLQTDPSVIYGLAGGRGSLGRPLTRPDLDTMTAYNTYLVDGLPPTPIANPGRAALLAAVQPAQVDLLYFVADGSGGHAFARTLDEHNRNVARWRHNREQVRATPPALGSGGSQPIDTTH